MRKTIEPWGLPFHYSNECWICGHRLYSTTQRRHGFQETPAPHKREKREDWEKFGRFQEICSICLQVQIGINKDSLHKEGCNGSPFIRMYLCDPDMKRIAVWKVLDHKPWLEQIQKLPPKLPV